MHPHVAATVGANLLFALSLAAQAQVADTVFSVPRGLFSAPFRPMISTNTASAIGASAGTTATLSALSALKACRNDAVCDTRCAPNRCAR